MTVRPETPPFWTVRLIGAPCGRRLRYGRRARSGGDGAACDPVDAACPHHRGTSRETVPAWPARPLRRGRFGLRPRRSGRSASSGHLAGDGPGVAGALAPAGTGGDGAACDPVVLDGPPHRGALRPAGRGCVIGVPDALRLALRLARAGGLARGDRAGRGCTGGEPRRGAGADGRARTGRCRTWTRERGAFTRERRVSTPKRGTWTRMEGVDARTRGVRHAETCSRRTEAVIDSMR